MIQKIGIIFLILVVTGMSIFVYFNRNKNIISNNTIDVGSGISNTSVQPDTVYKESEIKGNWDPAVMRTGATIQDKSGTTVTIITNGPPMRASTPEEQIEFQNSLLGN